MSALSPAAAGLLCLAVAMGIGRFAFTPILPMMAMPVSDGGWLAAANYAGYLAGAASAMALRARPDAFIRVGLATVGITTLAMAFTGSFGAWMVLRFAAGVASAWVLVNVSTLAASRPEIVFSGVGVGIAGAGLVCLALMLAGSTAAQAWTALGVIALVLAALLWRTHAEAGAAPPAAPFRWSRENALLVACYGAFGFGYIIPATFLPAMAKQAIPDPVAFGLVWPVYGAAAAASTMLAGRARRRWGDRNVWAASHLLMAAGVGVLLVPGIAPALAMTASALLVGGTFMVATMAGLQEARRLAGAGARTLIAAMTTAFATGQIAGPLVVGVLGDASVCLAAAVILLVATALALRRIP